MDNPELKEGCDVEGMENRRVRDPWEVERMEHRGVRDPFASEGRECSLHYADDSPCFFDWFSMAGRLALMLAGLLRNRNC
jgi:hypothetical protein